MGQTREQKIISQLAGKQQEVRTAIGTDIFIPNHSGTHDAGIKNLTPVKDNDLVNKKYVDDEINNITPTQAVFTLPIPAGNANIYEVPGWAWTGQTAYGSNSGMWAYPIYVSRPTTYNGFSYNLTTAPAGKAYMRMNIFNIDKTTGQPTTIKFDSGKILLDVTTGAKTHIYDNFVLGEGWYWLAFTLDTAIAMSGFSSTQQRHSLSGICSSPSYSTSFSLYGRLGANYVWVDGFPNPIVDPDATGFRPYSFNGLGQIKLLRVAG